MNRMQNSLRTILNCKWLPWVALAPLFVLVMLDLWLNHAVFIDSDMASELILSKTLWDTKSIITDQWCYSTELRVLNTQLIFAPLFGLFSSWKMVRVVGTAILTALLVGSFLLYYRKSGFTLPGAWIALLLVGGMSDQYYSYTVKSTCYVAYVIVIFVSLALFLSIRRKKALLLVLFLLLAILSGLAGTRLLLCLYLPLFMASVSFFLWKEKAHLADFDFDWNSEHFTYCITSAVGLAGCLAGYLINTKILEKFLYFKTYDDLHYLSVSFERLELLVNGWREVIGFIWDGNVTDLFGLITMFLFAVYLCLVVVSCIYVVVLRSELPEKQLIAFWFAIVSSITVSAAVLFLDVEFSSRHLLPSAVCLVIPVAIFLNHYRGNPIRLIAVLGIVAVSFWGCLFSLYSAVTRTEVPERVEIIEQLRAHNATKGYASFWIANVLTELSDGEIECWCYSVFDEGYDPGDLSYWLQLTSHNTPPEGENIFLAMTKEQSKETNFKAPAKLNKIYEGDEYVVYLFPDYAALLGSVIPEEELFHHYSAAKGTNPFWFCPFGYSF